MNPILDLDAHDLIAAYRAKTLSPREVMDAVLDAAEGAAPLNAFAVIDNAGARARAAASEARWRAGAPLTVNGLTADGVPLTIKENINWVGQVQRRGSRVGPADPSPASSPAVDSAMAAGANPFAVTTMPEWGWKGLTNGPLWGASRNPWNTAFDPGGSSGGAAIAGALGIGPLHMGTDGAGSVRIPASFCGLFGLKTSRGRVPAYPPSPMGPLAILGPLTRSVRDGALLAALMSRPDPRDPTAMHETWCDGTAGLEAGVRGLRIAWSPRLGYIDRVDAEVEQSAAAAAQVFATLGATVEAADPGIADPLPVTLPIWQAGAWAVLRAVPEARWHEVDPGFVALAEAGRALSAADYIAALNARQPHCLALARFHERYDLLLTPTLATTGVEVGHNTPADGRFGDRWFDWAPFSHPFNLSQQPAATVPCGIAANGVPMGLQIVGPYGADALVLRAARAFEAAAPWPRRAVPR